MLIREGFYHSRSSAIWTGRRPSISTSRFRRNARRELQRPAKALAISGIVGGLTMGLTGLSVSVVSSMLEFAAGAVCGAAFLSHGVHGGDSGARAAVHGEHAVSGGADSGGAPHFLSTARLLGDRVPVAMWRGHFCSRFWLHAPRRSAPDTLHALVQLGTQAAIPTMRHIFWSGVVGGWIIAMVAWLVSGSHSITGSVAVIWA